jgi:hypothetical protein
MKLDAALCVEEKSPSLRPHRVEKYRLRTALESHAIPLRRASGACRYPNARQGRTQRVSIGHDLPTQWPVSGRMTP